MLVCITLNAPRGVPYGTPPAPVRAVEQKPHAPLAKHELPVVESVPNTSPTRWHPVRVEGDRIVLDGVNVTDKLGLIGEEMLGLQKSIITVEDKLALTKARNEQRPTVGTVYFVTQPFTPRAPVEGVNLDSSIRAWVRIAAVWEFPNDQKLPWQVVSDKWEHNFLEAPTKPRFHLPLSDFKGPARLFVWLYPLDDAACAALRTPPTSEQLTIVYREPR